MTPWTEAHQASLSFTIPQSLLKLMSLSQWCHPTISSSVVPFSSCLHSFPVLGYYLISRHYVSDGQGIGASVSASVLINYIKDWFHLGLTGLIFLQSKELSRVFSNTTVQKHQFFGTQPSFWSNSHIQASLIAQSVKNLPAVQEIQVRSLGWEDPLEKEMATHSSILAWKI